MEKAKKIFFLLPFILFLLIGAHGYGEESTYTNARYGFSITYPSTCRVLKNYQRLPIIIYLPKNNNSFFNENIIVSVSTTRSKDKSAEEFVDIYFKYDNTVLEKKRLEINDIKFLSVIQTQEKKILFLKFKLKVYHLITVKGNLIYTLTYAAQLDKFERRLKEAKKIMQTFRFI